MSTEDTVREKFKVTLNRLGLYTAATFKEILAEFTVETLRNLSLDDMKKGSVLAAYLEATKNEKK